MRIGIGSCDVEIEPMLENLKQSITDQASARGIASVGKSSFLLTLHQFRVQVFSELLDLQVEFIAVAFSLESLLCLFIRVTLTFDVGILQAVNSASQLPSDVFSQPFQI